MVKEGLVEFEVKNVTPLKPQNENQQRGFIFLLTLVVIISIALLWISTKHHSLISIFKTNDIQADSYELESVKERLLEYAVLQPEIYTTNDSNAYQNSAQIPAPGYFPCPDLDGDGDLEGVETSCSNPFTDTTIQQIDNTGFVPDAGAIGYVPSFIGSHHIYFAEAGRYYYFLDERFSAQNSAPGNVNDGLMRYAPMNPAQFVGAVSPVPASGEEFEPVLTLNGRRGYIALIIDPGADGSLDDANNVDATSGLVDRFFVSRASDLSDDPNADKIVGITLQDLDNAINRRLCVERFRYEGFQYADQNGDGAPDEVNPFTAIASDLKHWYNDYVYTAHNDPANNAGGADWRKTNLKCRYEY